MRKKPKWEECEDGVWVLNLPTFFGEEVNMQLSVHDRGDMWAWQVWRLDNGTTYDWGNESTFSKAKETVRKAARSFLKNEVAAINYAIKNSLAR